MTREIDRDGEWEVTRHGNVIARALVVPSDEWKADRAAEAAAEAAQPQKMSVEERLQRVEAASGITDAGLSSR